MRFFTYFSRGVLLSGAAWLCAPAGYTAELGDLDGTWASLSCEVRPQPASDGSVTEWWLTRNITMADGRIEAEFTTYAGPGCDVPLQVLGFAGGVVKSGDSSLTRDAIEADLTIDDYVRFTPLAQEFADFLNSAPRGSCGRDTWAIGQSQDVHETGCGLIGLPANTPTVEYEVLVVKDEQLYFGARPVTGQFLSSPDQRPRALQVPLERVD